MLRNTLKRLVVEDHGMEMVEWAIVGVVFAVAAAARLGRRWRTASRTHSTMSKTR